ncbi:hypothetical protein [Pandoraea sputorum]|nr:hypothetical protein [Pandoraea sputorum]
MSAPKLLTLNEDPSLSDVRYETRADVFGDKTLIERAMKRLEGRIHFKVTLDKNNFLPHQSLVKQGALPQPHQLSTLEEVSLNFLECALTDDQFDELKHFLMDNPGILWMELKFPRCSCTESSSGLVKLYEALETLENLQDLTLDLNHSGFNFHSDTLKNLSSLIPKLKNLRRFMLDVSQHGFSNKSIEFLFKNLAAAKKISGIGLNFSESGKINEFTFDRICESITKLKNEATLFETTQPNKLAAFDSLHEFILDITYCENIVDETIDGLSEVLGHFKNLQRFALHMSNTRCTDASVAGLTRTAPSGLRRMEIYAEQCVNMTDEAHQLVKKWGESQNGEDVIATFHRWRA